MMNRRYAWAVLYVLVGLVAIAAVYNIQQISHVTDAIRESQQQKAPQISQTNRAAHAAEQGTRRIEACTTPGRACYDRGQRRLAVIVSGLTQGSQRAASAAAACAASLDRPSYDAVYRCVLRTLAADQHHRH